MRYNGCLQPGLYDLLHYIYPADNHWEHLAVIRLSDSGRDSAIHRHHYRHD